MEGHTNPRQPEDLIAGCIVGLTPTQSARLRTINLNNSIEIERRGDGWVQLRVINPDGVLVHDELLPPV